MMNKDEARLSREVFNKYETATIDSIALRSPYEVIVIYEHPTPDGYEENFEFYPFDTETEARSFVHDSYDELLRFDKENGICSDGEIAPTSILAKVERYFADRTDTVAMSAVRIVAQK